MIWVTKWLDSLSVWFTEWAQWIKTEIKTNTHVLTCTDMYCHIWTFIDTYWVSITDNEMTKFAQWLKTKTTTITNSQTKKRVCYKCLKNWPNTKYEKLDKMGWLYISKFHIPLYCTRFQKQKVLENLCLPDLMEKICFYFQYNSEKNLPLSKFSKN